MSPAGLMLLAATDVPGTPAATGGSFGGQLAFWALTALVLGGAVLTVTRRNTVSAVMSLVASFFGLAGLYLLLSAQFLAALQVLVYAGAIMTLFVFVVMVLNRDEAEPWAMRNVVWKVLGSAGALYLFVKGALLLYDHAPSFPTTPPPAGFGGVADVGELLYTKYLFPFEALSLMLLVAVIGAVVVARTPRKTLDDHAGGLSHHDGQAADDGAATDDHHEGH